MLDIRDFGALGDGATINTAAIQAAIDRAARTGETVLIPAGVFRTGTLLLKGASLHLESGAVLKASENLDDYPVQPFRHNEMGDLRALLVNIGYDNVCIDGSGTIDLSDKSFYDTSVYNVPKSRVPFTESQKAECTYPIGKRPNQCIFFHNSKNITLRGIRVIDAPCWTMTFSVCENVKVLGLTIDTDLNVPNNDGIHICSSNGILISDCHISSGDDCIALSGITAWEKPCENIVITNCVLRSCSKALVMGYVYSTVRNVLISNVIIRESNRGLTIMCSDECALVENVRVQNMVIDTRVRAGNWWGNGEPIFFMAVKHDELIPRAQRPARETPCAIRNVHVTGATCFGENAIGIVGTNGNIRGVVLRDIDFTKRPSQNLPLKGSTFDFSPGTAQVEVPEDCGVYIGGGAEVALENVNTGAWCVVREE